MSDVISGCLKRLMRVYKVDEVDEVDIHPLENEAILLFSSGCISTSSTL